MHPSLVLLACFLAIPVPPTLAQSPGSFSDGGNTLVSAMMLFLGNTQKVYILDKAEGNPATINQHPAWGAVWDIQSHQATVMDVATNVFCASGMHLPNGSYVTFGGNNAVGPGGVSSGGFDSTYQDYDGTKSIRILNPCTSADDWTSPNCQWFDNASLIAMHKQRWYSAAEPLANGTIVLIGGFVNGGYINRNFPNTDPAFQGGAAEPTYEFYPSNGAPAQIMQFMIKTSGLNAYAHTFLLSSGKMFVQANVSTIIWDYNSNIETDLPDMPNGVVRVYPASGAVAMLPLTPANNYTQTILFCGGTDMPADAYGDYSHPAINTWEYPASRDCHRITPEPADGSSPSYVQDDDLLETRTMGQFIILPDGKMLIVNGGNNGTAGYATATGQTPSLGFMPFGESLASGPVGTPAIYDPNAPAGSRWSNKGLSSSNTPRLYHSSAILLPDASVLIAGSNPNVDVNMTTVFPTTYQAEIFYPPYFAAATRPTPSGVPSTLTYGGNPFDITLTASSYSSSANDAADKTIVVLTRGGFTTHAMNMGQRYLQLNNTYTVNKDGTITLHVAQLPPNPNIFQPGPALLWVVVNGVPSNGTMLIVGNGQISTQPLLPVSVLPDSTQLTAGSGSGSNTDGSGGDSKSTGATRAPAIVGGIVGAIAVIAVVGVLVGMWLSRRRRAVGTGPGAIGSYAMGSTGSTGAFGGKGAGAAGVYGHSRDLRSSDSSAFMPLGHDNQSMAWNGSNVSLTGHGPPQSQFGFGYGYPGSYRDEGDARESGTGMSLDFDPYATVPRTPTGQF